MARLDGNRGSDIKEQRKPIVDRILDIAKVRCTASGINFVLPLVLNIASIGEKSFGFILHPTSHGINLCYWKTKFLKKKQGKSGSRNLPLKFFKCPKSSCYGFSRTIKI